MGRHGAQGRYAAVWRQPGLLIRSGGGTHPLVRCLQTPGTSVGEAGVVGGEDRFADVAAGGLEPILAIGVAGSSAAGRKPGPTVVTYPYRRGRASRSVQ